MNTEQEIKATLSDAFTEYQQAYSSNEDAQGRAFPRNDFPDVVSYMASKVWPTVKQLQAKLATANEQLANLQKLPAVLGPYKLLEAENKRLRAGLMTVRRCTEIMEARRFAEETLTEKP